MTERPDVSQQGQEPSLKAEIRRWVDRLEVAMFPHQESEEEQESFTDVGRKRVSRVIREILEEASAEHTRAILRYTAKGYAAGENTDAKHWRKRAEDAEAALASASASPHPETFSENETKDVLTALYQDGHVDLVLADRIAALMACQKADAEQPAEVLECHWSIDDKGGDSVYETQCGHNFYFDDSSGADENGFRCCPYCCLRLVEVKTSEAIND